MPVGHVRELDGVRAVAVSLVFLNHFTPAVALPYLDAVRQVGWLGVDIFFVLSGFLITGILLDSRAQHYYRDFFVRRTLRIAPLYYALLFVLFGALLVLNDGAGYVEFLQGWGTPLWFFLYLGNVRTGLWGIEPPPSFVPMWSLHVEEQFYLLFPFIVRSLGRQRLTYLLWTVVIGAPLLRTVLYLWSPEKELLQYLLLPCRMDALAIGGLVAARLRGGPLFISRRTLATGIVVLLVSAWGVFWAGGLSFNSPLERTIGYSLFDGAFGFALLWILGHRGEATTRWLNWRPLQHLGRVSYGVYLLQMPAAWAVSALALRVGLGADWTATVLGATVLAVVVVGLATASWLLLEQPILALKDRLAPRVQGRRPMPTATPGVLYERRQYPRG